MFNDVKQILFLLLYILLSLILSMKVSSTVEKNNGEEGRIDVVITFIGLLLIGFISYNLLFN